MTTINDISDLARVLREHPEWREAIRALVLGEEVSRLPAHLASFIETTQRNAEAADERAAALDKRLDDFVETTQRNAEAADQRAAALDKRLDDFVETTQRNAEAADQRAAALDKRLDDFVETTRRNAEAADQRAAALDKRLDDFVEATRRNFEAVDKRLEAMDRPIAALDKRLEDFIETTQRNAEAADQRAAALDKRLEEFIAATQENFRMVYQRLDRLEEGEDRLGAGLSRLTGRVDNGLGAYYEFRAEKLVRSLAGRDLDLSRVRVLLGARTGFGNQFADLLEDAWRAGLVTRDQYQELLQMELVFAAQRNSDGAAVHVAAEVSITAGDSDIVRVARRAAALSAITGGEVLPAVISAHIDNSRTILAAEQSVRVMLLPES